MNRAQMQVHWIFVIAAGSLILIFLIGFAVKYNDLQSAKLDADIARYIDNAINGLKVNEQFKIVQLSEITNLEFGCDDFIVNKNYKHRWPENIVFAPKNLNGDNLIVWAKKFELPFAIDKLIFISEVNNKIYLIDDIYAREFKSYIPSIFNNIELIDIEALSNLDKSGYKKTKVVAFSNSYNLNFLESDIDVVYIDPDDYAFLSKDLILGKIFSDEESFTCSIEKIYEKSSLVARIYFEKSLYLRDCCSNYRCNYNSISALLRSYDNFMTNKINNNQINIIKEDLVQKNEVLFGNDCRVVF